MFEGRRQGCCRYNMERKAKDGGQFGEVRECMNVIDNTFVKAAWQIRYDEISVDYAIKPRETSIPPTTSLKGLPNVLDPSTATSLRAAENVSSANARFFFFSKRLSVRSVGYSNNLKGQT